MSSGGWRSGELRTCVLWMTCVYSPRTLSQPSSSNLRGRDVPTYMQAKHSHIKNKKLKKDTHTHFLKRKKVRCSFNETCVREPFDNYLEN